MTQQTRREAFQTSKASQIVAGGKSDAATPGSKNAITQSILKGCQIASTQVLRTVEEIGVAVAAPLMETPFLACKNASQRCRRGRVGRTAGPLGRKPVENLTVVLSLDVVSSIAPTLTTQNQHQNQGLFGTSIPCDHSPWDANLCTIFISLSQMPASNGTCDTADRSLKDPAHVQKLCDRNRYRLLAINFQK